MHSPTHFQIAVQRKKARYAGFSRTVKRRRLLGALDLAGLHATRANVSLAHMALGVADGDLLDIGLEPTVRNAVRVADITTCSGLLAAYFTNLRHSYQLH